MATDLPRNHYSCTVAVNLPRWADEEATLLGYESGQSVDSVVTRLVEQALRDSAALRLYRETFPDG